MTFNSEIRGMRFFLADDGTRAYRTLATAEVYLADLQMTLHDVRLTWSPDRGFVAHAPNSPKTAPQPLVQWYHRGPFALDLSEKLRDMFERMGGKMPSESTTKQQAGLNAARRVAEKPKAKPQPIERRVVPATFRVHDEEANDNEAVAGLARTLSVEQQEAARVLG